MTATGYKTSSLSKVILLFACSFSRLPNPAHGTAGCPEDCSQVVCLSDVSPDSCPTGTVYQENVVTCGCCPACIKFRTVDEECEASYEVSKLKFTRSGIIKSENCAPGLICDGKCILDEGTCSSYKYQTDNIMNHYCDPDGTYSAVQCKGDTLNGRCFCYKADGTRLFGSSWWRFAENMTCACSREVDDIQATGQRTDISLHCALDGNYEELQCDDGLCWCADTKTGLPLTVVVPETMMKILQCYIELPDKPSYIRECESISISVNKIKDISRRHGSLATSVTLEKCDPDGSYGAVQIVERQSHCTRKDKTVIGNWQSPINEIKDMDCNCARDIEYYEDYGMNFFMDCAPNGDYKIMQTDGDDNQFCVDADGFPITELGSTTLCTQG